MAKKISSFVAIIIVFALGCELNIKDKENGFGGTLYFAHPSPPTIIHPILTLDSSAVYIVPLVFNSIVQFDVTGKYILDLAESINISQNNLEYFIKLKKGVKFHDGKELTSKDVKFTFDSIKKLNDKKSYNILLYDLSIVERIEIVDNYSLKITLQTPFAPFYYSLSAGILPKHIYEAVGHSPELKKIKPIGSGPFQVKEITDKEVVLSRHESYFKGRPYLEKIICQNYSQPAILVKLLREEVDCTRNVSLMHLKEIDRVEFLRCYDVFEPAFYMLFLNCSKPLFKNKKIRQVLNYAVDKESIIKKILNGRGEVCYSPILPANFFHNKKLKPYPYEPQQALNILKELGWVKNQDDGFLYKDGKLFAFDCLIVKGYTDALKSALLIQNQLDDIGIKMEVKLLKNVEEFYKQRQENSWDSFFCGTESAFEPDRNYTSFHSSNIGGSNVSNYKNVVVDSLLELGRKTMNQEERKNIYYDFQKVLFDDPPGVFAFYRSTSIVLNKRVKNALPDDYIFFRDIKNWQVEGRKK